MNAVIQVTGTLAAINIISKLSVQVIRNKHALTSLVIQSCSESNIYQHLDISHVYDTNVYLNSLQAGMWLAPFVKMASVTLRKSD